MKLIIIAAIGKNRELGINNNLIWRIREDLKFFKEKTTGHFIVMGKKTFLSLNGLLPNRKHLVISSTLEEMKGVKVYKTIEELLNDEILFNEEVYVIGGASIYKELIDYTEEMYLTHINEEADADVYFPKFNQEEWNKELLGEYTFNDLEYKRVLYKRK